MDTKLHIKKLVEHIISKPNLKHAAQYFYINEHSLEYGDTKIRPNAKEHKLWTPCKDRKHRCFLMIQLVDNKCLRIHHVLDDAEKWLKMGKYTSLHLSQPQTYATERGAKDQFQGAIEINLSDIRKIVEHDPIIDKITNLIKDITDETVDRKLNFRRYQRDGHNNI
jgi:hypothetical protein